MCQTSVVQPQMIVSIMTFDCHYYDFTFIPAKRNLIARSLFKITALSTDNLIQGTG